MQFHGSGGEGQRHPPPLALAEPEPPLPRKLRLTKPRGEGFTAHCSWMGLMTVLLLVVKGPWEVLGGEGPLSPAEGDPEERRAGWPKPQVSAAGAETAASHWSLLLPRDAGSNLPRQLLQAWYSTAEPSSCSSSGS